MLRVVCRFHDDEGNVTYLRSDDEFNEGMVDKFDANGRTILQMGPHAESIEMFTDLAGDFLEDAQYDRFAAHLEAAGVAAPRNEPTPQDENEEPTSQEYVEAEVESGQITSEAPQVAPNPVQ